LYHSAKPVPEQPKQFSDVTISDPTREYQRTSRWVLKGDIPEIDASKEILNLAITFIRHQRLIFIDFNDSRSGLDCFRFSFEGSLEHQHHCNDHNRYIVVKFYFVFCGFGCIIGRPLYLASSRALRVSPPKIGFCEFLIFPNLP
jgi:hypothetical protein